MTLAFHGKEVPLAEVREVAGTGRDGVDAQRLLDAAHFYGLTGRGVRAELDQLDLLPRGSILHWTLNHFVVLDRVRRDGGAWICDPMGGRRYVTKKQLDGSFSGVALILEPGPTFRTEVRARKGTWRYLWPMLGQKWLLARIVLLSAFLRIFALAVPLLTLTVIARIVPGNDRGLLLVLAGALAAIVTYNVLSAWLRAILLLQLRTQLDVRLALAFFQHLVDLPYVFFLKRSAGDLMMRLRSNNTVRDLLTTSTIAAALDGVLVCLYTVLLLAADWPLGLLAFGLGALQVGVLLASGRRNRQLMRDALELEARTQAYTFQVLTGIETLKAAGSEHRAVGQWWNLFIRELNLGVARGRLNALVDAAMSTLRLAAPLAVLSLGALQVLAGQITLAAMLALVALAAGFLEPLATLVTTALQLQFLGTYMERINDVLDLPAEQAGIDVRPAPRLRGGIRTENLRFRYAPLAPFVVDGVSLAVAPGQKLAIVGRSGSGKTTLAHLLLSLYPPTEGRVFYDDVDVATLEVRSLRQQIGIVTQNTYVFSGSIRENIALTAPQVLDEQVAEAARCACIDEDIEAMPMGYETILVENGATLSGGQRQRLALARAVLGQPRILLLDEATSALDALTEAAVYRNLNALGCTTIVVAHRLSTIADSDVIAVLEAGRLVEAGTHAELLKRDHTYARLVGAQSTLAGRLPNEGG
jgi:ABC-type bacteriocin/lantibiotic exporter with double-glycine peptidase domain